MNATKSNPSRVIFSASIILLNLTGLRAFAQNSVDPTIIKDKEVQLESTYGNNPDYSGFYNDYGYFLLGQNRVDEAIEKLTKQVALAPESANAHECLGEALLKKSIVKESLAEYERALELNPYFKSAKDKINGIQRTDGK